MWKYVIKRIIALIPVIIGVTFIVFMIMQLAPGDPAKIAAGEQADPETIEAVRIEFGLDKPLLVQYGRFLKGAVKLDFGKSYAHKQPVFDLIKIRFPYTLRLATVAVVVSVALAIPLGVLAAVKHNTLIDGISMFIALIGVSMPIFWLGLLLILLFSLHLGWLPTSGAEYWYSIILPAISLGFSNMANIARVTRSSMLEVIRNDYVRTAKSKGLSNWVVIRKHAFKNALIPTITVVGLQVGSLLGGSVITESVFAWPGVGGLVIDAINARDIPMILGCIVVLTFSFSIVNLVVDLLYAVVDPRIRSSF